MKSEQYLLQILTDSLTRNFSDFPDRILVALSGGVDSMALVLTAKKWCERCNILLKSVTIDHKLRSDSDQEAKKVAEVMQSNNIDHQIITWYDGDKLSSNIEAKAREARYELLIDYAKEHNISVIVTAHHQDDQIETFFMRLLRGSGIDGLAAMKEKKKLTDHITLWRPFLNITKQDLKEYLLSRQQTWFEDDSNENIMFLRNNVRQLLYKIADKELIDKRIIQTINHFDRAKDFLEKYTEEIFSKFVQQEKEQLIIEVEKFKNLHQEIALRLLIRIFKDINGGYNKPRFKNLFNLYQKIINNQINKSTTFSSTIIAIKNDKIIFKSEM